MTLQGFYTNKGRALAAKIAAGTAEMTVTRVVSGDGHTADIPSATDLPSQKQTLHIGQPSVSGSTATLPVTLLEAEAASSYDLTELGIYAADPDVGEILFQVYQLDAAEAITAYGEGVLRFYLRQTVGADGMTVTCSPAGVLLEEDIAELRAKAAYADHRNLLDNAWFTVNQRGKGTQAQPWTVNEYGVDRWLSGSSTISVTENGITYRSGNWNGGIVQFLENDFFEHLAGKPITVSAMDFDGVIYTTTIPSYDPSISEGYWENIYDAYGAKYMHLIIEKSYTSTYGRVQFTNGGEEKNYSFRAVKLEIGEVSTLANDIEPDYAQELAKCQRYFQRFKTQSLRPTDKDDFRPVMRVNPATSTITVGGTTYYTATADL